MKLTFIHYFSINQSFKCDDVLYVNEIITETRDKIKQEILSCLSKYSYIIASILFLKGE
jgi:hypothetical protein